MNYEPPFAPRTKNMGANMIREILKVVSQPGMTSLAGGIPAPESFPLDIIKELTDIVLQKYSWRALQYDPTEGFTPLREALVAYLEKKGIKTAAAEICISSGSQGVLDAIGKIFISKGDTIAVEAPTYLGAISAFNPYEPRYVCMEMDEDGLIPDELEKVLNNTKVKFVYLVPTFQNPTGRTIPLERRRKIVALVEKYNAILIEDDPYSALRYRGEPIPTFKSMSPDHVVYTTTLSKVFAPGLRIGIYVAPEPIRRWLVTAKQGIDLHSSTFNQALACEYISGGYLDRQLPKIINLYKPKQEAMLSALEKYFPAEYSWSKPEGGMFIWAEGPKGADLVKLYWKCIERKTAFVPGKYFYPHPNQGLETMRLNYTMSDEGNIEGAIKTISEVIASGF
ncbi:PLP-dependent aminotransferase family protein [candidate division KSB1 bacterium]|nr:PLP-dependent aminotransferase family protein [candidate division KSB1 bacterium]